MNLLKDYDLNLKHRACVKEKSLITPAGTREEVQHIVLEVLGNEPFDYTEGQTIGVIVPGPHEFGNPTHFRLYSISSGKKEFKDGRMLSISVRRCFYIDDYSGEECKGVASNYLCDLPLGAEITITGPYAGAFTLPKDPAANLLMIGVGTGIAPFRSFVKTIYKKSARAKAQAKTEGKKSSSKAWKGKVRLFYGGKSGVELLYMNDHVNDFTSYYDEDTFKAFAALSPRPAMNHPIALDRKIEENAAEVWELLESPKTHVYLAGLDKMAPNLEKVFAKLAGSESAWQVKKETMRSEGRWAELFY
ncbi:MAG: oxidoreductase [Candidatus Hydrogenedentes bacterium]|nr:oxidoreductase [Candidatus Hydrogenedentota bacterium]